MADLEELGYIASPHTSAGRVPTPKGYRFFVDTPDGGEAARPTARSSGSKASSPPTGRSSSSTPRRSSSRSSRTSPAWSSRPSGASRRSAISSSCACPTGACCSSSSRRKATCRTASCTPTGRTRRAQLIEATNFFNQHYAGQPFGAVRSLLAEELTSLREDIVGLMTAAVDVGGAAMHEGEALVVTGEKNLLNAGDLASNMDRLRRLFDLFEQKTSLLHLLDASQKAQGVHLYIGDESGLVPLDECSVVTAPYDRRRPGDRHARRDRPDAHGLRARDPDRRHHGEAAVERADRAAQRGLSRRRRRRAAANAALIERVLRGARPPRCRRDDRLLRAGRALLRSGVSGPRRRRRRRDVADALRAAARTSRSSRPTSAPTATTGRAHWVATYTYSATGRPVENRIDATFEFRDGRIVRHRDRFDLYRWARQALGPKGLLLGWLPPVQARDPPAGGRRARRVAGEGTTGAEARLRAERRSATRATDPCASRARCPTFRPDRRSPTIARRASACCWSTSARPTRRRRRRCAAISPNSCPTGASSKSRPRSGSRSCTASCCACGRPSRRASTRRSGATTARRCSCTACGSARCCRACSASG